MSKADILGKHTARLLAGESAQEPEMSAKEKIGETNPDDTVPYKDKWEEWVTKEPDWDQGYGVND